MAKQISVGIDIGSFETKVIIAQSSADSGRGIHQIIGTGVSESRGVEKGYIVGSEEAALSVKRAIEIAEKAAGVRVKRAYVSFGGVGLGSITATGSVAITRADLEITERDLDLCLETAEMAIPKSALINKRVINEIPVEYKLDGKIAWGDPLGLKAQKLEVKALFLVCLEHHLADLIKTVELAGVEVEDVLAAPVGASFVTVSKKQRRVGCLLADIGAETTSVIVFENNNPVSLEVFPIGGMDITNDIALGLKVSLEEAETIKFGGFSRTPYSKKKLDDIVSARLGDCFELIEKHLKSIGRDSLLPAGVMLTGGSAGIAGIKNFAQDFLGLPAEIASIHFGEGQSNKIRETIWATACGLSLLGFDSNEESRIFGKRGGVLTPEGGSEMFRKFSRWISQFLP